MLCSLFLLIFVHILKAICNSKLIEVKWELLGPSPQANVIFDDFL